MKSLSFLTLAFLPYVKRISESEFQIEVNPGVFGNEKSKLEELILPRQTDSHYKVRIHWVDTEKAYKIVVESGLYVRSSSNTEKMILGNNATTGTFPHEFGHGLGLRDAYFTIWQPANCSYVDQYNEKEIMSESSRSAATPRDWEELNSAYPWDPMPF